METQIRQFTPHVDLSADGMARIIRCMMIDSLSNAHDKFFRESFSYKQTAYDFLRLYVPHSLNQHFDLDTLEINKDSFIDPELQEHFSDVLYQLQLKTGQPLNIYILFEHKSYPAPRIGYQLLRYMVRIWEQQEKQGQTELLPILPLVIYHGERPWSIDTAFQGLFSGPLPEAFQPYLPNYRYWLLDLSDYPDEQIKGWAILQACLRLLKYIRSPELGPQFAQAIRLLLELSNQETALEYLYTMLRYAVSAAQQTSEEELKTIVIDMMEQGDELMTTIAEKWFEEGMQVGFDKGETIGFKKGQTVGFEEGHEQGQRRGYRNMLVRTLTRLFAEPSPALIATIDRLNLEQLRQASDLAFDAASLAEFEARISAWLVESGKA